MRISRTGFESMCDVVVVSRTKRISNQTRNDNVGTDRPNVPAALLRAISGFPYQFVSSLILFFSSQSPIHSGLADRLEASKHTTSHNDWQQLALDIRKLRKSLTDATSFLTTYDQRQCQAVRSPNILNISSTRIHPLIQQMDILEQTLEEIRSASLPKTKFTFKRKTNKPPVSVAPALLPSSDELGKRDDRPGPSDFHRLSSHSHCRLSLQSISTFGAGPPLSDLTISDLDHCVVDLRVAAEPASRQNQHSLTALHIHDLKETVLMLPNVEGSVLLHNLYRCTVIVACHQAGIFLSI